MVVKVKRSKTTIYQNVRSFLINQSQLFFLAKHRFLNDNSVASSFFISSYDGDDGDDAKVTSQRVMASKVIKNFAQTEVLRYKSALIFWEFVQSGLLTKLRKSFF